MIENKIKKFFNKDGFLIDEFAEVIQDYVGDYTHKSSIEVQKFNKSTKV